jgi:hypothetical protein
MADVRRRSVSFLSESLFGSGDGPIETELLNEQAQLFEFQFLLGHASVQTTERYLGCKQKLSQAVNDNLGLEDS